MQHTDLKEKKRIIIYCLNISDGFGDFAHGVDIYDALKDDPNYKDYEIVFVNDVNKERFQSAKKILTEKYGVNDNIFLFSYDDATDASEAIKNSFSPDPDDPDAADEILAEAEKKRQEVIEKQVRTILEKNKNAQAIIQVSTGLPTPLLGKITAMMLPKSYPHFIIGEHGGTTYAPLLSNEKQIPSNIITMGFNSNEYGILIKQQPTTRSEQEKVNIIKRMDAKFTHHLFKQDITQMTDDMIADQLNKTLIIPAYLHCGRKEMIMSLGANTHIKEENIVFYINRVGRNKDDIKDDIKSIVEYLKPYVGKISLNIGGNELNFEGKNTSKKEVRILTDFNLNDDDFDALYKLGKSFAGSGGDKTLEKAISHHHIPWYCLSTKVDMHASLVQLAVNITGSTKSELVTYFKLLPLLDANIKYNDKQTYQTLLSEILEKEDMSFFNDVELIPDEIAKINLEKLSQQWQQLEAYIQSNKNLYTKLPDIFKTIQLTIAIYQQDLDAIKKLGDQIKVTDKILSNILLPKRSDSMFVLAAKSSNKTFQVMLETYLERQTGGAEKINSIWKVYNQIKVENEQRRQLTSDQLTHIISHLQDAFLNVLADYKIPNDQFTRILKEVISDKNFASFISHQASTSTQFMPELKGEQLEKEIQLHLNFAQSNQKDKNIKNE